MKNEMFAELLDSAHEAVEHAQGKREAANDDAPDSAEGAEAPRCHNDPAPHTCAIFEAAIAEDRFVKIATRNEGQGPTVLTGHRVSSGGSLVAVFGDHESTSVPRSPEFLGKSTDVRTSLALALLHTHAVIRCKSRHIDVCVLVE